MSYPRLVVVIPALCATLIAQGARDTGPGIAAPFFATVAPGTPDPSGTGMAATDQVYARKAGFGTVAASTPRATRPDFTFAAIFAHAPAGPYDVDAFTIGADQLHTDCEGMIDLRTCNCWTRVFFTVEDGIGIAGTTGVVRQEMNRVDGAGADVFCYVPATASLIAASLKGVTTRAVDSTETGLFLGGSTPTKGQLASLDMLAPLYELDDFVVNYLDPDPIVYFSVTNTTRSRVPVGWWGGSVPSGATILRRQWDSAGGHWVTLAPLYTYSDLGVAANAEIDALAYNQGLDHLVLSFSRSTTPAGLSQLVFARNCVDGPITLNDLTESDGSTGTRRVVDSIGVGSTGEVRGVCEDDPALSAAQPPLTAGLMAHILGTPDQEIVPEWTTLAGQVYRSCDPVGNVTFTAHLTGLPPGPGPSLAVFIVGVPTVLSASDVVFIVPTRPTQGAGDPVSAELILPPVLTLLSSGQLQGMWVAIDTTTSAIALSNPLTIFL